MNKKIVKISIYNSRCTPSEIMQGNGDAILDNICILADTDENLETGEYYLDATFIIDKEGLWNHIQEESILKVQMDYGEEYFRIAKVQSTSRDITVFARQETIYQTLHMWLTDVRPENQNGQGALSHIRDNSTGPKNTRVSSDISTISTAYYQDMNMYKALHDCDQSFANRWGGEIQRRGYNLTINKRIGTHRGVQIRSRKNLTGFEANVDIDNVFTRIKPVGYDGITIDGFVYSPLINNYPLSKTTTIKYDDVKVKDPDKTDDEGFNTLQEAQTELIRLSELEFSQNNIDKIKASYRINFVQLEQTEEYKNYVAAERVFLGDEVDVYEETLDVSITVRALRRKYDVLRQRVIEVELSNEAEQNKPPSIGDIIDSLDKINNEIKDNNEWYKDAINNATDLIKNGLKDSYVIVRKNEILIMDTTDINTAVNVWRWNRGGLGFSSTGYYGEFDTAITMDGSIVGKFITGLVINGEQINAKGLKVVNAGNTTTLEILNNGDVSLDVNNFKLRGKDIYTRDEADEAKYYDITKGGYINVDFISNFSNRTIDIQKKYNKPNYDTTYCKYSSNYSLQKSVTAPLVSVIQSFYLQKDKDIIYFTQLQIGGRDLGNLKLYKYKYSTWTYQSEMKLNEFGHGQAFSIESRSDGDYVWIECDASSKGYGRKISCFKYTAGATYTRTAGTEYILQEGHTANSVSIDYKNNIFCLYSRSNNATLHNYTIFDFASVKNGSPVMLGYFQLPRKADDPDHQGFDICNKYIYVAEGTSYDTSPNSNHYIKIYDYQGNLIKNYIQKMGYDYANREPEGIQIIENDAQNYELWTNIINGPSGARVQNFFKLIYTEPDIEVPAKFVHPKGASIDIDNNPIKINNLFSRGYLLYIDNPKLNGLSIASSYNQHLIVATVSGNAWKYENTVFYPSNNDCIIGEILIKDDKYTISNIANSYGSVFEMLTDGGNLQGIWLENGKLYINAEQLRGQTLEGVNVSTLPNYSRWGTRCKMEYDHFGVYRGNQLIAQMGMNYDPNSPLDMKKSRAFLELGGEFDIDKDGPDSLIISKYVEVDDHFATIRNFAGDGSTTSKIVTAIDFYDSGRLDLLALKNIRFYAGDEFKFIGAFGLSQDLEDAEGTAPGDYYRTLQMGNNAMVFVSNNAGNWTFKRWNGSYSALYAESFNVRTTTLDATNEAMAFGLNSIVENEVDIADIIENNIVTRTASGTKLEPIPFTNIENEIENRIYQKDDAGNVCNNQTEMIYVLWETVQKLTNDIKNLQSKIIELEKEGV